MAVHRAHNKKWVALTLLATGVLFYFMNVYTPMSGDDFLYMYSFYDGMRIESIRDILVSQYAHYFSMNGRVIVHFLAQFFHLLGKPIFNGINVIAFLAFGVYTTPSAP